jgi:hypothetical protein
MSVAMKKISGILPPSTRVPPADLKDAHPSRPGTPDFGQPMGTTSKERLNISALAREVSRSKIPDELAQKFFETKSYGRKLSAPAPVESHVPQESTGETLPEGAAVQEMSEL